VEEGVKAFRKNPDNYGVNFSNAEYIDEGGRHLRYFYPMETGKKVIQGDLFAQLVMSYIISSPTTMFKKEVIDKMGGYDESLAYEDFDFWVRSSREWHYCYTDKVLVKKRVVVNSLGSQQYKRKSVQRMSTYTVCKKAYDLCRSPAEFNALRKRIQYELKYSIWHFNLWLSCRYVLLWLKSIR